jgi:hypothetical protein
MVVADRLTGTTEIHCTTVTKRVESRAPQAERGDERERERDPEIRSVLLRTRTG